MYFFQIIQYIGHQQAGRDIYNNMIDTIGANFQLQCFKCIMYCEIFDETFHGSIVIEFDYNWVGPIFLLCETI